MPEHTQEILVGNHGLIKYINKKNVLDTILQEEPVSRIVISKRVKLAMPTVMRIVDEFINDGLIIEIGKGSSNGGRKPNLLSVKAGARHFLATTISGSVRSVVANMRGEILSDCESEIDFSGREDYILTQLKNCMRRAIEGCGLTPKDIAYSGIGTPGMGFKYYTPGKTSHVFGYWSKISIDFFKKQGQFEYPTAIENVAKMGALGELRYGKGKYYSDYLFIFADTGVGMGVVKNGSFELGAGGAAGEFGHTIIDYNGPECYCGNRGCIESYCSTIALCNEYKRERINNKLDAAHDYTIVEVAEAVKRGESSAVSVAKRIGMLLGIGIANAINLYNPEAVIVGGGLCEVPLCIEATFEEAKRHIFRNASRDVIFLISSRDNPMLIMGTIAYAMENYFDEYCKC